MIKRIYSKQFVIAVLSGIGSTYATSWLIIESVRAYLNCTGDIKWYHTLALLIIVIIAGIYIGIQTVCPKKYKFVLKGTKTEVEIVYGDLFKQKGHKVISSSDFFDSEIGMPVSTESLLGKFITGPLNNNSKAIDQAVENQLKDQEIGTMHRTAGKMKKYKIGTTITIPDNPNVPKFKYFLFALAESDVNCVVHATPELMEEALRGLWDKVRIEAGGTIVNVPLIGDGLARVGLGADQLLDLILNSLQQACNSLELGSRIRIVLTPKVFYSTDLETIKNYWR
jgi:hypothetical protein